MVKQKYKLQTTIFDRNGRKLQALPGQSMTIEQMQERFVKNIPIDIKQHEGQYIAQEGDDEYDFEQVARMSFDEKAAFAAELKQRQEALKSEYAEKRRAKLEAIKAEHDAKVKAAAEKLAAEQAAKSIVKP